MVSSSLFRASRQTRTEGLHLFYRHHHFHICVEHGGCFLAILRWLQNIGAAARGNIRLLRIRYTAKCCPYDVCLMERVHATLSAQASVMYISKYAESLWRVAQLYHARHLQKVPVFFVQTDYKQWDMTILGAKPPFNHLRGIKPGWQYLLMFPPQRIVIRYNSLQYNTRHRLSKGWRGVRMISLS